MAFTLEELRKWSADLVWECHPLGGLGSGGEMTDLDDLWYLVPDPEDQDIINGLFERGWVVFNLTYTPYDTSENKWQAKFLLLNDAPYNEIRAGSGTTPGEAIRAAEKVIKAG